MRPGCRGFKSHRARYFFAFSFFEYAALEKLGLPSNKLTKNRESWVVRITKQSDVRRFLAQIGFRNPHHLRRIRRFPNNLKPNSDKILVLGL